MLLDVLQNCDVVQQRRGLPLKFADAPGIGAAIQRELATLCLPSLSDLVTVVNELGGLLQAKSDEEADRDDGHVKQKFP
ncbi:MAG: hypothetical protein WBE91_03810 [Steroidobacteraceae bacterium]